MTRTEWLNTIAPIIQREAFERGYKYPSAIIAQAINESGWGQSLLAVKYHNYFGMKCGSSWKGKSVNLNTREEYSKGTLTNIRANFRAYDSMEEGVKGYFDFIKKPRYSNLLFATSSYNYLELIKQDGYATSSGYVNNVYMTVTLNGLQAYDQPPEDVIETVSDEFIRKTAEDAIAGKYGDGENRKRVIGKYYKDIQSKVNEILKGR